MKLIEMLEIENYSKNKDLVKINWNFEEEKMKLKRLKEKRGITLIALVVTVIVILVLAGISISMLSGENGILKRATEAKRNTQIENEKEAVNMAVLEAVTIGNGEITADNLNSSLKSYIGKKTEFTGNGPWIYEGEQGVYVINANGKVYRGWANKYDENGAVDSVTNGEITLNVGDYINYDPGTEKTYTSPKGTDQATATKEVYYVTGPDGNENPTWICAEASEYQSMLDAGTIEKGNGYENQTYSLIDTSKVKWKVLRANEENGELLIVAADVLKNNDGTTKIMKFKGITGYLYGVDELNKACNIYGSGKGATGGRSITYDDIAKVIGLEKKENSDEYVYTWTSESINKFSPSYDGGKKYLSYYHVKRDETTKKPGTIGVFNYYNVNNGKWETNTQELKGLTETKQITKIKPDYIGYFDVTSVQKSTKGYSVVFKNENGNEIEQNNKYWLGTSVCSASNSSVYWGMYFVFSGGYVNGNNMYDSFGNINSPGYGIRPVVSLNSNIKLTLSTTNEKTYEIE